MARILVADDDNIAGTLVCRLFASADHEVVEACDGEQALAACLHSPAPDVAVLDHRMLHLTRLEVARRIRIPFHMMSAEETARAECMRLGGLAYLSKPPAIRSCQQRSYGHYELASRPDPVQCRAT